MAELRKIGIVSVMKLCFVLYAIIGLLVGLVITAMSLLMTAALQSADTPSFVGFIFGPLAIIIMPIFYGILGALFSGFAALIYNLLAARVGGIQVLILFPKS